MKYFRFPIFLLPVQMKYIYSIHLQGRRTFQIVHDIINCCNDPELMQTVKLSKRVKKACFVFMSRVHFFNLVALFSASNRASSPNCVMRTVHIRLDTDISDDCWDGHIPDYRSEL